MSKESVECYTAVLMNGRRVPMTIDPAGAELDHHGPVTSCERCMEDIRTAVLNAYGSAIDHMEPDCGCGQGKRWMES